MPLSLSLEVEVLFLCRKCIVYLFRALLGRNFIILYGEHAEEYFKWNSPGCRLSPGGGWRTGDIPAAGGEMNGATKEEEGNEWAVGAHRVEWSWLTTSLSRRDVLYAGAGSEQTESKVKMLKLQTWLWVRNTIII